ncbi:HAD family hydrolase [Rubritalea marina]|uniref:HAD family hydrolase n=1 Tax=Rubritalea marina TaxID=361055 RepID=UPI00035EEB85|nr:HAD family hydrolase [Rubritalea marina]
MNKIEKLEKVRVIGFDADDTLWVNETYFREAEEKFASLLSDYEVHERVGRELFRVEIDNLGRYGYGVKGFVLSMIECALDLSNHQVPQKVISEIMDMGKEMLEHPIELLPHVEEVMAKLQQRYRLIVVTKGDLLDQERKLQRSGIAHYFHHVEILHDKQEENYRKLLHQQDIAPQEFLMVGNSLKSDVLPVVGIGAQAVHIPYHTTWAHEEPDPHAHDSTSYLSLASIAELPGHVLRPN